jgi:hypothetical protein
MTDGTFDLIAEGWVTSSIGCRTLKRSKTVVSQSYRPISFILSLNENYASYKLLLNATKVILFIGEGFRLVTTVINMDHCDGAIKCFQEDDKGMFIY